MHVNLTYEQFVQELRNWIIKATHLPEDYVFFKKKEKLIWKAGTSVRD